MAYIAHDNGHFIYLTIMLMMMKNICVTMLMMMIKNIRVTMLMMMMMIKNTWVTMLMMMMMMMMTMMMMIKNIRAKTVLGQTLPHFVSIRVWQLPMSVHFFKQFTWFTHFCQQIHVANVAHLKLVFGKPNLDCSMQLFHWNKSPQEDQTLIKCFLLRMTMTCKCTVSIGLKARNKSVKQKYSQTIMFKNAIRNNVENCNMG